MTEWSRVESSRIIGKRSSRIPFSGWRACPGLNFIDWPPGWLNAGRTSNSFIRKSNVLSDDSRKGNRYVLSRLKWWDRDNVILVMWMILLLLVALVKLLWILLRVLLLRELLWRILLTWVPICLVAGGIRWRHRHPRTRSSFPSLLHATVQY